MSTAISSLIEQWKQAVTAKDVAARFGDPLDDEDEEVEAAE